MLAEDLADENAMESASAAIDMASAAQSLDLFDLAAPTFTTFNFFSPISL